MSEKLFAVCPPGLEATLAAELAGLGVSGTVETGGVAFEGGISMVYRANLHLRSASRVLLRVGEFYAAAFSELRKKASRFPWETRLRAERPVAIRVTCHHSKLYHSGGVTERLAGALEDRLKRAVQVVKFDEDAQPAPQLIIARLENDLCTLSLDTSGELLHRRGYRLETAKAPLRENLAAGMLLASGYDGSAAFLDPFCGSGTLPIEAALIAGRTAPGKKRRFAFMDWPGYETRLWKLLVEEAENSEHAPEYPICASDRDDGAVRIAGDNARRAGVETWVQLSRRAVSAAEVVGPRGWVITNPPYGVRVSEGKDLRNLYAQFGNLLRADFQGWQVGFVTNTRALAGQVGLRLEERLRFTNGGIPVTFYQGSV